MLTTRGFLNSHLYYIDWGVCRTARRRGVRRGLLPNTPSYDLGERSTPPLAAARSDTARATQHVGRVTPSLRLNVANSSNQLRYINTVGATDGDTASRGPIPRVCMRFHAVLRLLPLTSMYNDVDTGSFAMRQE